MANQRINIPPPSGDISLDVGNTLTIHAARQCIFCCTIGSNFSTDISNIELSAGDHVYTAVTQGQGTYNSSEPPATCTASGGVTLNSKSIQINQ